MKKLYALLLILSFLLMSACGANPASTSSIPLSQSSQSSLSETAAPDLNSEILAEKAPVASNQESAVDATASSLYDISPEAVPTPYVHPSEKDPSEWDDLDILIMAISSTLSDRVGNSHVESVSGNEISISIWEDGISFAYLTSSLIPEQKDKWDSFTESLDSIYTSISQYMSENGYSDYTLICNIVSDENHSVALYSIPADPTQDSSPHALNTPTPSASPTDSSKSDALELPAFEKQYYSGSSDSVITDISLPDGAIYYAYISNSGNRNFTVKVYDSSEHYDLAVNEIGYYTGFYLFESTDISRIEVHSNGDWSISIAQLTFPDDSNEITTLSSSGHYVSYLFDAPSGTWTFTHNGTSNFIVNSYVTDGTVLLRKNHSLLVNTVGAYSGECYVKVPDGMHLVFCIEADGDWTADLAG